MSRVRTRWLRRYPAPGQVLMVVLVVLLLWRLGTIESQPPALPAAGIDLQVERVVDGDTLLMEGGFRVRLLGVDTPETKHPQRPAEPFGLEAAEWTRKRVEGRLVRLEFDRERHDDYGRWLAYVFVDGSLVNEELIRAGLSEAETRFPIRSDRARSFEKAERFARASRLGIWSVGSIP